MRIPAYLTLGGMLAACGGCGPSIGKLDTLARSGQIDELAPIRAHATIQIAAPRQRVWQILVTAQQWPRWNNSIGEVSASRPLSTGDSFVWQLGTNTIHSRVQLCEPDNRLAWTGTVFTAKAVHLWKLSAEDATHTRVEVDESMDGLLMAKLMSANDLTALCQDWLAALKKAAEQP